MILALLEDCSSDTDWKGTKFIVKCQKMYNS